MKYSIKKIAVNPFAVGIAVGLFTATATMIFASWFNARYYLQSPIIIRSPIESRYVSPIPDSVTVIHSEESESVMNKETEITPTITPTPTKQSRRLKGEASYYSEDGCMGCDPNLIMANGERLDDTKLTFALPPHVVNEFKLLNDNLKIVNVKTGKEVIARVTDTGGFFDLTNGKRIADLSVATKEALGCASLCEVEVQY